MDEPRQSRTVACPTHGLRYDPTRSDGCLRCEREAAGRQGRRAWLLGGAAVIAVGGVGTTFHCVKRRGSRQGDVRASQSKSAGAEPVEYAQGQSGALLVPEAAKEPRPLLLLFDPQGYALGIVRRYSVAASRRKWLAASTTAIFNGSPEVTDKEQLLLLFDYVRARFPVDAEQVYTGGFSGGGCFAYRTALQQTLPVKGAIVECGHLGPWRSVGRLAQPKQRFFVFSRLEDFNRVQSHELAAALSRAGCRATYVEKPGGHAPMLPEELEEALRWMEAV